MSDSENTSLDELLQKWEKAKINRAASLKRATRRAALSAIPLGVAFLLIPFLGRELLNSSFLGMLFLGLALLPIISFFSGMVGIVFSESEWNLFQAIAKYDEDKRVLPIALSSLMEQSVTLPKEALLKLIQRVDASDTEMLRDSQRGLWAFVKQDFYSDRSMTYEEMREMKFAAVQALGKVGGYNVLGDVERFAAGLAQSNTDAPLLEALQEVLPAIRQRTAESLTAQSLLRASDGKRDDATLLRASSDTHETQKEQLLRANIQDNSPDT